MAKSPLKLSIIVGIVIILILSLSMFINDSYVVVSMDGENISTFMLTAPFLYDNQKISNEINDYVFNEVNNNLSANISDIKKGIENITQNNGIGDTIINIDTPFGDNQIPILFIVNGTSMVPTLEDNQQIIVLKTKDIKVGDIVVANDSQYGIIVKRVSEINGSEVYLTSDNKNVETIYINGIPYNKQGITTWIDISNIIGVVKKY